MRAEDRISTALRQCLLPRTDGGWIIGPLGVAPLEEALLALADDPALVDAILFITGLAHSLGGEAVSREAAIALVSAIGKVRPRLVVLDRAEQLLEQLAGEERRRAAAFGVVDPAHLAAPAEGEPAPHGSVKVRALDPAPTRLR
jgi:hypothetical protein